MASGPITSWQIDGETNKTVTDFIFWAPKSLQMVTVVMKFMTLAPWKKSYDPPRQHIKKAETLFCPQVTSSQGHDFSSSPVWM